MKQCIVTFLFLWLACIGVSGNAVAENPDGLLAYYPFNGNANDESGNGNDGSVVGATPTTDRFGTPGSAYHFDDENDYVNVSAGSFSLLSTSFTINSWVKTNDYQGNAFIRRNNHANYTCGLGQHNGKLVSAFAYAYSLSPNYVVLWAETPITLNEWMMITAVYDRDQRKAQLYYNGKLEDEKSTPGDPVNDGNHPHEFGNWYGTRNAWNYEPFVGDLDDIRIYNRALAPEEIAALYDIGDNDYDDDGISDNVDNCPDIANPSQDDLDNDNIGDTCDLDIDGDGVENVNDNCAWTANIGQEDTDGDNDGDACDEDDDNDGVLDTADNCSLISNPGQEDADEDGQGDVCDGDLDGDGVANETDNCPNVANGSQADYDKDGTGDVCDSDVDGDDVANDGDACAFTELDFIVDAAGCSIDQLCPCEGPRGIASLWKNHGKFVSCTAKSAESFVEDGLITEAEKDAIVSDAAQSDCGDKK